MDNARIHHDHDDGIVELADRFGGSLGRSTVGDQQRRQFGP